MDSFLAFLKVVGSLLLVLVLAYGSLRYLVPLLQRGGISVQRNLEIIERLAVAPRISLCLVKVGNRYFLIGITPTKISYLQEISAEEIMLPEKKAVSGCFAETLQARMNKFPFVGQQGDEDD